jgi:membrane protein
MLTQAKELALRMFKQVQDDDVIGLSAELAYRWFLAIFPFAIFVAAVGSEVARRLDIQNPAQLAKDELTGFLPPEAATLIGQELERIIESQQAGIASFAIILAVWFATGGTNAVIKAMNRAYDVEESRPIWRRYPLAIGITLVGALAVLASFILVVVGQVVAADVVAGLGIGEAAWTLIQVARWPVAAGMVFAGVVMLFRLAPNIRMRWRWIVPGALAFTAAWLVATFLFGLYVARFSDYGATFGALAGVAILLIWFYLSALILLLGAELNGVLVEMREPGALAARRGEANRSLPATDDGAGPTAPEGEVAARSGRGSRTAPAGADRRG